MKRILALAAVIALAGCGVDVASSAATAASLKKQEVEQGQKTMKHAQQQIDSAVKQMQASSKAAEQQ